MPANTIHVKTGLVLHDLERIGMNLTVKKYFFFIFTKNSIICKLIVNLRFSFVRIFSISTYLYKKKIWKKNEYGRGIKINRKLKYKKRKMINKILLFIKFIFI